MHKIFSALKPGFFLFFLFVASAFVLAAAHAETPALRTHVNDYAGVLSPADQARLNRVAAKFEDSRPDHPQIVVLTVKELPDGETIKSFSNSVFHAWGLGQKGVDNGVLVVMSMSPKKIRVEVGRGLEGDITDIQSDDILSAMKVKLADKNFYGAFDVAINTLISKFPEPVAVVSATPASGKSDIVATKKHNDDGGFPWGAALIAIALIGSIPLLLRRVLARTQKDDGSDLGGTRARPAPPAPNWTNTGAFQSTPATRGETVAPAQTSGGLGETAAIVAGTAAVTATTLSLAEAARARADADRAREESSRLRRRLDEEDEEDRRRRRSSDDSSWGASAKTPSATSSWGAGNGWGGDDRSSQSDNDTETGNGGDSDGGGADSDF